MSNLDKLVYWIKERDQILQRKIEGLPPPWSEDRTFQTTYFCNVRREDDKVTKWIREKYAASSQPMPEFNMMVARLINKPSSLETMGWPFTSWTLFEQGCFINMMANKGSWGSAYIVSTNGRPMPKHEYIAGLLNAAHSHFEQHPLPSTLATAHTALMGIQGLGSFMAGQIVADLKNTPSHALAKAPDWWTWCAHGPGSLRGMSWVAETKVTPSTFGLYMDQLRVEVDNALSDDPASEHIPMFCNQDLQNCLCEFDKYMRVSTGTGRSKRKYNGTHS